MSKFEVYVTYLEKEGPFLKLWVQLNRSSAMFVEKLIRQYTDQFERGLFITHPSALIPGGMCCAKYIDGMYYRARIISLANVSDGEIYVQFCDFGNKEVVPVANIRNVQVRAGDPQPPLVAVPDQATEFYLAGVLPPQGEWDDSTVEHIRQKLGYEEFQAIIVGETARKKLLALYSQDIDISQFLIQEGLAVAITPSAQQMISQSLHTSQHVSQKVNTPTVPWQPFTPPPSVSRVVTVKPNPAYQAETMRAARTNVNMKKTSVQQGSGRVFGVPVLEVGSEHMVYVSYVEDGPLAFSVQLKACEEQISNISIELNENPPQPMLKPLVPGSVCLGRFSEDHLLCRAVVMSVMDDRCMVYYVDFGNSEALPFSDIYEIPDKFMNLKSLALRYSLAGMRDIPLNDDLKSEFEKIVLNKLLTMKVVTPEGPPVKQYCELYLDGTNVKDFLIEKLKLQQLSQGYKKIPIPAVGLVEKVYVSYVHSVSNFYVQLEATASGLTNIMNYLESYCTRTQVQGFSPTQLQVGMPCCALYETDGRWYRAKITGVESNMVHVFYVDYGNSGTVPLNSLCKIEPTLLSQSPEQAIHCILNGYENSGTNDDISATFELIVIEKLLSMKVVKHVPGGIVVDLYDATVQPMKNIADLLNVSPTRPPAAIAAPPELDNDWQESTPVGTAYGDNASASSQREQYGGRGGNEDRNAPFRKSQRHDSSVSHWQNKGEEMSLESSDAGIAKGGNRFPSGGHHRDDHKSNNEAGRMGSEKEWDRNSRFGNKGGRYRDENTEPDGESQGDVFQSDRGRDRPYDSNRQGGGGRFRVSDRENDGESWRSSNRDSSRSFDDNRGGSYGNRERGGGNRRGGRFGDRDNDGAGQENDGESWRSSNRDSSRSFDDNRGGGYGNRERGGGNRRGGRFGDRDNDGADQENDGENWRSSNRDSSRSFDDNRGGSYGNRERGGGNRRGGRFGDRDNDGADQENDGENWRSSNRDSSRSFDDNRGGSYGNRERGGGNRRGGRFGDRDNDGADRENDGENWRSSNRDSTRSFDDNRGGSYGNRERGGGNRRGGRFGDRDNDGSGGDRGGRRFGTAAENSGSEDSSWNNNRKWEEKSDRNANKRDRWNSKDAGSSYGSYQNDAVTTAVPAEEDEWGETETEPSLKTIPPIDVQLNTEHTMQLIYVENPSEFCLQMTDDSKLNAMMEQIAAKYGDGGGTQLDNIKEGVTCAALYSLDGSWNRAVIQTVHTDTVLCRFIDYGNSDEIPHSGLKILEKEFELLPAQAVKCVLFCAKPSAGSWSEEEIMRFKEATDGKVINTKFVKRKADVYDVILREAADCSKSINEDFGAEPSELENIAAAASVPSGIYDNVDSVCATFGDKYQLQNTVGTKHDVVVSWFVNPENFYCQLISLQNELKNMMESIQTDYRKKKHQNVDVVVDTPVIARFKSDKVLYRAIVKELKGSAVVVQYIDFGNCDITDTSDIWPLEKKYLSYPVYALQCCLKDVKPRNSEWQVSPSDVRKFFSEKLVCTFHEQVDNKYMITLESNGSSVAEALITEGIAVEDEKAPSATNLSATVEEELDLSLCQGQCLAANVTYVFSLTKFFVHLNPARAAEIQASIENHMQQHSETAGKLPSSLLKQGKMCLATPDGVSWYRAVIMETRQGHVTTNFIDFGDSAEVPLERVAPIPSDMVSCHRLAIECSVVGSSSDTSGELDEQFKLEVEEQDVILHVDSVCEDRLCVRLFDVEGQRLELLKELYNENLQEVEPVCPLPVLSSKMRVCVSHVEDTAPFFWIQNTQDIAGLAQLLESWFDFYETKASGKDLTDIKPGKLCAAKSGNDDNWYRARINSVDNENVSVSFLDYGNTETVPFTNIKVLDDGFYSPHAMALKVCLPVNVIDNEKTVSEFQNYTAEKEFIAQLSRNTSEDECWFIDLISDGKRLIDELSNLGLFTEAEDSPFAGHFMVKSIAEGVKTSVYVTHVESPSRFWVQLGSNLDEIEKLRNMLQKHADTADSMKTLPEIGMLCAAQYSEDASWYRAVVMDVEQSTVTVSFIDYGNTDKITLSSNGLKPLKPDLISLPPFGINCSLDITPLPGETEWSESAIKKFNEIVDETGGVMVAEVLKSTDVHIVTLYTDESNVSSILIELNLAMSPSKKLETLSEPSEVNKSETIGLHGNETDNSSVFVSHCESPADFWVQRKGATEKLQHITEQMENASNFCVFPDGKEGALCGALFKDDGLWYRARIISRNDDEISVQFIDYGNTSTTDEIRVLPSDLLQIPGIAEHCSLILPEEVNEWSEKACSEFLSLINGGETEFYMKLVKDGPLKVVSLDYNGELVELMLKQTNLKENDLGKVSTLTDETSNTAEVSEGNKFTVSKPDVKDDETNPEYKLHDSKINYKPEVDKKEDSEIKENVGAAGESVYVSHCDTPDDFWIQCKSAVEKLQHITERMADACNFSELSQSKEGEICAALYKDDGLWYRARILSCEDSEISVQFIDYGNTSTTDELRVLPSDLLQMPGIAEHCSLILPEGINEWSEKACSEFLRLVSGGETEFCMKLVKEGPLKVVSLDYNGESVELLLKQLYLKEGGLEKVSILQDEASNTAEGSEENKFTVSKPDVKDDETNPEYKLDDSKINDTPEVDKKEDSEIKENVRAAGELVYVSHCNAPDDFWIQYKSAVEKLQHITERMAGACNFSELSQSKEGEICAALYKDDDLWYRARILSCEDNEISVQFIDYGNTSTTDELRVLPSDLLQMPGIAEHCSLILPEGINEWSEKTCSEFLRLVSGGETEFCMKIVKEGPLKVVSLDYNGESVELLLKQLYLKEGGLEKVSILQDEASNTAEGSEENKFTVSKPDVKDDETNPEYKLDDSKINDTPEVDKKEDSEIKENVRAAGELVYVSHCNAPDDFWIQYKSAVEKLQHITERMAGACNFSELSQSKEGEICAALYKDDDLWYRARILSCEDNEISVQFIDYGNTSTTDELRVLPSDLLQMPGIAEHCSLILPEGINEWSEKTCSEFLRLVSGGETEFCMKIVKEGPLKVVSLDYNGESVELLLKQLYLKESGLEKVSILQDEASNTAEESEENKFTVSEPDVKDDETYPEYKLDDSKINDTPEVDKKEDSEIKENVRAAGELVYVSHCNAPDDFWIQCKSAVEKLQHITERMADACNFSELSQSKEGEICAALYKDDGLWYRARILSCEDNEISVQFIDYGNTSTTDELRVLPSDLLQMPGIAEHCSLILPEGINDWSEKACSEFLRLVSGGETEFCMKLVKEGPLKVVSLDYNGESVELLLKQLYLKESGLEKVSILPDEASNTAEESENKMFDVSKPEITEGESNPVCKEIDTSVSSHNKSDESKMNDVPKDSPEGDISGDTELCTSTSVFVSHCDSPKDFWVQRKSAVEQLHYVTKRMNESSNFTLCSDAKEGDLCAALYKDDGLWYRARILSCDNNQISVQFIDYGNTSTTDELRVLPSDLLQMPGLAEHCSLILPEGINEWSENSCLEFLSLVSGGETEFHMKLVKEGPLKVISLEFNGEPVELKLKQSYSKESLQEVSRPIDETSDTVEQHMNGTSASDKTLLQNTELQIKTNHSEMLIQDLNVEVTVQSLPDETKKDSVAAQKVCEHSPADAATPEASIDENDTTSDLLR